MKAILSFLWEIVKIVVVAMAIVVPVRYFLFQPFLVRGQSMEPNFENGDYLIIDEISYRMRPPQRGEVIVFNYPQNPSQRFIKRIIGLPGEKVEVREGRVFVYKDGREITLDESGYLPQSAQTPGSVDLQLGSGEYFVMGDNRTFSLDSRSWGTLPEKEIIGRVYLRILPFVAFAKIEVPAY